MRRLKDLLLIILIVAVGFLAYDKYSNKNNYNNEKIIADENIEKEEADIDKLLDKILDKNEYLEIKDEESKEEIRNVLKKALEDENVRNDLKNSKLKIKDGKVNVELDLKDIGSKVKNGAEISADLVKELIKESNK